MNINQVWPEWNEDCVLGEGSFGKVFRVKRVEYGRVFYSAVKVISVPKSAQEIRLARSQGMNDAEIYLYFKGLVENLINEITLMDNLKGAKNIVGIEDYKIIEREGEIGWDIFIRMELLSPFDSFASNPNFSQGDVVKLGVDICSALECCEQNSIIHRDIKPDNIFVSRFGEYKLGDFGIARKLEATQANLSKKGTLNYMAPEIYKGENYGSNVDIYSLGLVLYTLLNNNRVAFLPPYPQPITYNDNENALYYRLSGAQIPLPVNADSSLGHVVLKACAYNPAERYQTATEFKNALLVEWNRLQQMGTVMNNQRVNVGAVNNGSLNDRTIIDMTNNGTVVASEFQQNESFTNYPVQMTVDNSIYSGKGSRGMPGLYGKSGPSKLARIVSIPLAIVSAVLGMMVFSAADNNLGKATAICSIVIALIALVSDYNKRAIGMCLSLLSGTYLIPSAFELFGKLNEGLPIEALILFISGLLILFAGFVKIVQKEDRLSGALCIYSFLIFALYNIYGAINKIFDFNMLNISVSVTAITVAVWSFGYNRDAELNSVKKIIHIATYIIGVVASVVTLMLIATYVKDQL